MTDRRLGCYVYCVIRAGERPQLEGVESVNPAHGIELLTHADLTAVINQVDLDEFGSDALKRNLEELGWLERTALAHNAVLARACRCDAVVPFRTCTIFDDQARVREMLEHKRAYFLEQLKLLQGRDEWSVKMVADQHRLEMITRARHPPPVAPASAGEKRDTPGRAFFTRKTLDRSIAEEAATLARSTAQHAHTQLRQHAAGSRLLPPQNPRLSRRPGKMILNGAYLVDRPVAAEFGATIDQLRRDECPNGVELILSGPFAPYNFVDAPEEM